LGQRFVKEGETVASSSDSSQSSGPFSFIRNPRDFWGGVGVLIFAAIAWWATSNLPGQQGFAFGPGTAPRLFIFLTAVIALAIIGASLFTEGPGLEAWSIRGPLFVLGAILLFAATIRSMGLVPATFLLVVVSGFASKDTRLVESVIWGIVLSAFCAFLFPYVLNLPMQLWPRF
jgi:putative tricarboxylic transport membrane protein